MDCSNSGPPILRWPYYQDISHPGRTMGHCPWCMETFPIGQDVPKHKSESLDEAIPGPHSKEVRE
jgi:hypothetical protein